MNRRGRCGATSHPEVELVAFDFPGGLEIDAKRLLEHLAQREATLRRGLLCQHEQPIVEIDASSHT